MGVDIVSLTTSRGMDKRLDHFQQMDPSDRGLLYGGLDVK